MSQCKECGATLPENARYCLQCGTEATEANRSAISTEPPKELDFLKPSVAGGLSLGVLSSLPIVSILCCLWVPLGGGLAAYLLNKQRPGRITMGDGAFAGVISGLIGAIVATIISIPVKMMNRQALEQARQQFEEAMQRAGDVPPAFRSLMENVLSPDITATGILFGFIFSAIVFGLLAMVGGILGAALLRRGAE